LLAGVAERGMAEIVSQRQGLGEILVESECAADRARDLRHFEGVGLARSIVVALVIDKDLRLVRQPAERGRMDDAVAVALKRRAHRVLWFRMEPPAALLRLRCVGCQIAWPRHTLKLGCGGYPATLTPGTIARKCYLS